MPLRFGGGIDAPQGNFSGSDAGRSPAIYLAAYTHSASVGNRYPDVNGIFATIRLPTSRYAGTNFSFLLSQLRKRAASSQVIDTAGCLSPSRPGPELCCGRNCRYCALVISVSPIKKLLVNSTG
nr:hypothetical protein [uncultured bacterium]